MMQPFKKSVRRQLRHQSRVMSNRFSSLETLENRTLLTSTGFEIDFAPADQTAEVSQADSQRSVQRIVNGTQTSDYDSVGIVNNQCSGTLIAPNAVLTAAHCIPEGSSAAGQTFEVGGRTYEAERVVVHPDYSSQDIDLAVMILKQNVTGVEPTAISRTAPEVGQMLTLVGFGATGTPEAGHDDSFGVKHVGKTPIDEVTPTQVNWNFDNASEANTAPGDSGGPAFLEINGQLVVAGVTSGGLLDNAGLGDYSFDMRVDAFANWIDGIVDGNDSPNTNPGDEINDPVDEAGDPVDEDPTDEDPTDVGDDGPSDEEPFDEGKFDEEDPVQLALDELEYYDTNGDGVLSRRELVDELRDYGYSGAEAREEANYLLDEFDADGDRTLNLNELIVSYGGEAEDAIDEDELDDDFDIGIDDVVDETDDSQDDQYDYGPMDGDVDSDGWVGFNDFLVFSNNFGADGEMSFDDGDFNGDGTVGFDDFLGLSGNFGLSSDDWGFDARSQNEASTDEVFAAMCS